MKAAIYLRVSSEEQAERESPIAAQKAECLRWAAENGYQVAKRWIIEDRGFSGAEDARPGLQRLLATARSGPPFSAIIALDNTRFSRSEELFYWLRRELRTCGVEMLSATEHGEIELLTGVKAIIGAEQRRQIAVRTRLAMKHIASQGLRCGGRAPYGYRRKELRATSGNKPVTLEPDPETAPTLKRIFRMRAKGEGLRQIAHALNREGIPGPGTVGWGAYTIRSLLINPEYIGSAVYGRRLRAGRGSATSKWAPRENWQVIEGAHKAIVDRETWEAVQATFRAGSPTYRGRFAVHPLSGLIYCGVCGAKYHMGGGRGGYYQCAERKRGGPRACSNSRTVSRLALEARVNELILEALTWPENAREVYLELKRAVEREAQAAKKADRAGESVRKRAEIRRLEAQLRKHIDFIGRTGKRAPESLLDEIERLERRLKVLRAELAARQVAKIEPPDEETIRGMMAQAAQALEKGNPAKRREIYRTLIRRIVVSPRSVRIEGSDSGGFWSVGESVRRVRVPIGRRVGHYLVDDDLPVTCAGGGRENDRDHQDSYSSSHDSPPSPAAVAPPKRGAGACAGRIPPSAPARARDVP